MSGSHTLEKFINEVARGVIDPQTHVNVLERARAQRIANTSGEERKESRERNDLRIGALGSGSDYTPFLQHLGIAALNLGFGGEDGGGSYHSIYDSYTHFSRFVDPGFYYGIALARTAGRTTLRLASADVLPFEFTNLGETVGKYVKEVSKLADDMRESTEEQNRLIKESVLTLAADPTKAYVVPHVKDPVPYLNFAPLQNALVELQRSAREYDEVYRRTSLAKLSASNGAKLDEVLMTAEQAQTSGEGLPRRPWFIHQIYAPGAYTGYGVKTLPAVREAIELRIWKEAEEQISIVSGVFRQLSRHIERARALLSEAGKQ
jgi:N-acetylated-alpha-linked acidic dipeptidase